MAYTPGGNETILDIKLNLDLDIASMRKELGTLETAIANSEKKIEVMRVTSAQTMATLQQNLTAKQNKANKEKLAGLQQGISIEVGAVNTLTAAYNKYLGELHKITSVEKARNDLGLQAINTQISKVKEYTSLTAALGAKQNTMAKTSTGYGAFNTKTTSTGRVDNTAISFTSAHDKRIENEKRVQAELDAVFDKVTQERFNKIVAIEGETLQHKIAINKLDIEESRKATLDKEHLYQKVSQDMLENAQASYMKRKDLLAKATLDELRIEERAATARARLAQQQASIVANRVTKTNSTVVGDYSVIASRETISVQTDAQRKATQDTIASSKKMEQELATSARKVASEQIKAANETERAWKKTFMGAIKGGTTFGHKIATTAQYMAAGVGIMAVSSGITSMISAIVEADKALGMFQAVLEMSSTKAQGLQKDIFDVSKTFGGSITELNDTALALGRAGIANENLAQGIRSVSQLAMISGENLSTVTDVMVSWSTLYESSGYSLTQLGDIIVKVANESKASVADFNTMSTYILTAGQQAGLTAEALAAMAGAWKQIGKGSSTSGTEIRRFFNQLETGSDDVRKAYNNLGISMDKLKKGLSSTKTGESDATMRALFNKLSSVSESEGQKAIEGIGQVLDKATIKSLIAIAHSGKAGLNEFTRILVSAGNADGTADKAAGRVAITFEKMWERIKNTMTEQSVKLGDSLGNALFGSSTISDFNNKFNEIIPKIEGIFQSVSAVVTTVASVFKDLYDTMSPIIDLLSLSVEGWIKAISYLPQFSGLITNLVTAFAGYKVAVAVIPAIQESIALSTISMTKAFGINTGATVTNSLMQTARSNGLVWSTTTTEANSIATGANSVVVQANAAAAASAATARIALNSAIFIGASVLLGAKTVFVDYPNWLNSGTSATDELTRSTYKLSAALGTAAGATEYLRNIRRKATDEQLNEELDKAKDRLKEIEDKTSITEGIRQFVQSSSNIKKEITEQKYIVSGLERELINRKKLAETKAEQDRKDAATAAAKIKADISGNTPPSTKVETISSIESAARKLAKDKLELALENVKVAEQLYFLEKNMTDEAAQKYYHIHTALKDSREAIANAKIGKDEAYTSKEDKDVDLAKNTKEKTTAENELHAILVKNSREHDKQMISLEQQLKNIGYITEEQRISNADAEQRDQINLKYKNLIKDAQSINSEEGKKYAKDLTDEQTKQLEILTKQTEFQREQLRIQRELLDYTNKVTEANLSKTKALASGDIYGSQKADRDILDAEYKAKVAKLDKEYAAGGDNQASAKVEEYKLAIELAKTEYEYKKKTIAGQEDYLTLLGESNIKYAESISTAQSMLRITESGLSTLSSGLTSYFTIGDEGYGKWSVLRDNLLDAILKGLMQELVVNQMILQVRQAMAVASGGSSGGGIFGSLISAGMSYFTGGASTSATYDLPSNYDYSSMDINNPMGSGGAWAKGGVSVNGNPTYLAKGGSYVNSIVSKPTYVAKGTIAGEAGAEGVLPLQRDSQGRLGVNASGGSSGPQNITVNIVNESGEKLSVTKSEAKTDMSGMVLDIVIDAISRNKRGMRDMVRG